MDVNDDAQLLTRSRAGDAGAYAQLYERHVGTALHVARQLTDEAEDVVSDAFARTYTVLREGRGPDVAFRPYLLRAVRNAAIDRHRRVRRITPLGSLEDAETPLNHVQPTTDPAIDRLEQQLVARAFESLPERWQMVLWHTEVQGETPAQVAPLLGISPRAVAQLAVRAREGLRTAWLREHIVVAPPGHEEMVQLLAAHVRGSLGLRDRRALETHLTECADCRRLRDELKDVNNRLRVILVPALLGLSITKLAWGASPAAAAVAVPAAGADAVGTVRDGVSGLAAGSAQGSGTAGAATAAAVGGTVSAPSGAASTTAVGGLLGATMAAMSQPVTAGLVAAAVATTGFGAYVAIGSRPVDPAPPGESRPEQVTPPAPGSPGPASPSTGPFPGSPGPGSTDSASPTGSPGPASPSTGPFPGSPGPGPTDSASPTGSGSPSPTTAPGTGTPDSTGPTSSPSTSGSGTATDPSTSGSPSAGPGATSGGPAAGSSAPAASGSSPPSTSSSTSSSATPSTTVPSRRTPPP